ncbi:MAG: diguanylate cyclase [Candidatus Hydrogenedentota bacterium]
MRSFSVSGINTYLSCPRKFYFTNVEHLPQDREEQSKRFGLSNIIHAALADYHAGAGGDWSLLDAALSAHWDPHLFSDSRHAADSYHKARWMLWESFSHISSGNPVRFAYSFEHPFAGSRLRGRIDRIDESNGSLVVIDYALGAHKPVHGDWGLQIYAAAVAKIFQKSVAAVRIIQLGELDGIHEIVAEDARRIEGDVSRLCATMEADKEFAPKPERHCLFCSYATICDAAWRDEARRTVPGGKRPNELFRLFCAVEILMNAGDSMAAFRRCVDASIRQLHSSAASFWLDEHPVSDDVRRILETGTETEGEIALENETVRLLPGTSIIVPIASCCIALFPEQVSRTAAEILGRSLRIALDRVLNYQAAAVDGLTGLFRRELCTRELESTRDRKRTVIIADIDRFKTINDTYGHDAGDAAIRLVARILREQSGGVAYRLGGEEFVLLTPDDDMEFAAAQAEGIRLSIEKTPFVFFDKEISLTASLGVASSCGREDPEETLKRADQALYRAKQSGRNRVERAPTAPAET